MPNRLADETSPYLLQHANNPVDWFPWGEEAFAKARSEDRPVFLSIGYSACHWCHVMERESFEDQSIAALLNEHFVSIKVDREERPDVDSIYMKAVQMISGQGGWPMSMFLTPEGVPFWGGTYFPPADRYGRPGFPRVLRALSEAWKNDRQRLMESSEQLLGALQARMDVPGKAQLTPSSLEAAARSTAADFDPVHGGFGGAPKFPPSMSLDFLLQIATSRGDSALLHVVSHTLERMGRGGLFDQIGGGFHRYSVDERWLVPHFEKMLYDNALLARTYVRAWQATKNDELARIARETLDFVLRELTSPEGGFYSTLDADSEGEEGKFYVWSLQEVMKILGEREGRIFASMYDITETGNFEGHNIPNLVMTPTAAAAKFDIPGEEIVEIVARARCKLFGEREKRVRPARDEKILAGWNGWMLGAFAEAAIAFQHPRYLEAVRRNAAFLLEHLVDGPRVTRTWKEGRARIAGVLEDYSGVAWGLLLAFEAAGERRYLDAARRIADAILDRFPDPDGGYFDTPSDGEQLITRPKDVFDNATPSGNSVAADVFARLAIWLDDDRYRTAAESTITSLLPLGMRYPSGFGFLLSSAGWIAGAPREIVITGDSGDPKRQELLEAVARTWVPHRVLLSSRQEDLPLMNGRESDTTAVWICERYTCRAPITEVADLDRALAHGVNLS